MRNFWTVLEILAALICVPVAEDALVGGDRRPTMKNAGWTWLHRGKDRGFLWFTEGFHRRDVHFRAIWRRLRARVLFYGYIMVYWHLEMMMGYIRYIYSLKQTGTAAKSHISCRKLVPAPGQVRWSRERHTLRCPYSTTFEDIWMERKMDRWIDNDRHIIRG